MAMRRFDHVVAAALTYGYSDIHITGNMPTIYRKDGLIQFDRSSPWDPKEIDGLVGDLLNQRQIELLKKRWSVDLATVANKVRLRINIFNTTRGLSLAIRLLPATIPDLNSLNLHPSLQCIRDLKSGLVLVCGSAGSGKSTTICAILEEINRTRPVHIITLEDPIEYRFKPKRSFIEQRGVGVHVPSFKQGLMDALRENPDVIFVGELREPDTIQLALSAAESGHLVFATLHAYDVEDAAYRINNSAGSEGHETIRHQFASTIEWLVIQQLVWVERVGFRVPALAILRGTHSIKSLIRENRLAQLEMAMHTGKKDGMFTMERYISEYLHNQENFTRWQKMTFIADQEEPDYQTALIDPNASWDVGYQITAGDERRARHRAAPATGDGSHLVIEEDIDLEALIAQIDNFPHSKIEKQ